MTLFALLLLPLLPAHAIEAPDRDSWRQLLVATLGQATCVRVDACSLKIDDAHSVKIDGSIDDGFFVPTRVSLRSGADLLELDGAGAFQGGWLGSKNKHGRALSAAEADAALGRALEAWRAKIGVGG